MKHAKNQLERNLVAKHMRTFNKATVEQDKRQAVRSGYVKHKRNHADVCE